MTTDSVNVQPLALVHNKEVVYIEANEQNTERKFSCFKVFKLKGPIDVDYLLNLIFPPSEKNYYDLEVSEYNGQSAKVKFNFTNRRHTDLISHLQNAAEKIFNISENGLIDWLASDTVTFKTVYQSTDLTATQQLREDTSLDDFSDSASDNIFNSASDNIFNSASDNIFNSASDNIFNSTSSETSILNNAQLYPIVDELAIEREIKELSERISSQTSLSNYDLEKLFHSTFKRRDMTITIGELTSEFFSQVQNVVGIIWGGSGIKKAIDENLMLSPDIVLHDLARYLFKHLAEIHAKDFGVLGKFAINYKFGIILTLWNLINAFHSIHVSYQVLLESDERFKQILRSQKIQFMDCLSHMDQALMDLLITLDDELNNEKYERLQRRLVDFVHTTENLMKLIMIVNNQCNEQLEKLENQEKELSNKLWVAAVTIGIAAMVIGGFLYNNKKALKKHEKWIGGVLTCATGAATGVALIEGYSTKSKLQSAIQQQTNILGQLKLTHEKLTNWKDLGNQYIEQDINDMNNNRMTLIGKFVRIRSQCKCLGEIFEVYEEDE